MSVATIYSERMFRRFETDLGPCADKLRIPRAIFREPDFELSIDKYYRLLDCASRTTNPRIGLTIGSGMEAGDLGPLGHAAAASADVRQMLGVLSRYLYVFAHSNVLRIDVGPRLFAVAYDVTDSNIAMHQQDVELALAYAVRQIRALTGTEASPRIVEFAHAQPAYAKDLRKFFGGEMQFGRGGNRLHYSRNVLDLPIHSSDPSLLHALEIFLSERLKVRSEDADLGKKVVHLISTSLSSGMPEIGRIAATLGLSGRTLQRHLQDESLVFSEMVESVRRDIAEQYVQRSDFSLTDIALMLGYSELSAFSRAFRRWTGSSLQQARGSEPATTPRRRSHRAAASA